jgi:thiol-disulfide isomerase/thioredoxin
MALTTRRLLEVLFCSLLLTLAPCLSEAAEIADKDDEANYLYSGEDASPIIDYHAKMGGEDPDRPDFLFSPNNGPRVVEFYAPWCPHCKHFRNHYVSIAQQITKLAEETGQHVDVYAVSCTVHKPICKAFGIKGYPKIYLFEKGAHTNQTGEVNYWEMHPFKLLNALGMQAGDLQLQVEPVPTKEGRDVKEKKAVETTAVKRTKRQIYDDAYLSFHFSLQQGIFMTDSALTNTTKDAFHDWLELLRVALPPTWAIHDLIKALLKDFEKVSLSEDNLVAVIDQYPPKSTKWTVGCSYVS